MNHFNASDDPDSGAPNAVCDQRETMCQLAPASCQPKPGAVSPVFTFHRMDYTWLALALASAGDVGAPEAFLDTFCYGAHTLTWAAAHATVAHAIRAGFNVAHPSTVSHAVACALEWSAGRSDTLRQLQPGDFEALPSGGNRASGPAWWKTTTLSAWAMDGNLHPLCHAMGYAGTFWDERSRAPETRFHLALQLIQEFIPVTAAVPVALHGDPGVRFYRTTMLPPHLVLFPTGVSNLLSSLAVRWGYFNGTPAQARWLLLPCCRRC